MQAVKTGVIVDLARHRNKDLIHHIEILLEEAHSGKLTGLITASHYGSQGFGCSGAGTFCETPAAALLAVEQLRCMFLPRDLAVS